MSICANNENYVARRQATTTGLFLNIVARQNFNRVNRVRVVNRPLKTLIARFNLASNYS
jgi:hypothetical protein